MREGGGRRGPTLSLSQHLGQPLPGAATGSCRAPRVTSPWPPQVRLSKHTHPCMPPPPPPPPLPHKHTHTCSGLRLQFLCHHKRNAHAHTRTGFLHADPHPGNLIRTPDGRICVLDFGLMTEVRGGRCV